MCLSRLIKVESDTFDYLEKKCKKNRMLELKYKMLAKELEELRELMHEITTMPLYCDGTRS